MAELSLDRVDVRAGDALVVREASLQVTAGSLTVLLGPNGAGKTSLLRAAAGLIAPASGRVCLDGVDPRALAPQDRARRLAYLPQTRPLAWPLRVQDVIALGRYAYGAAPGALGDTDAAAVQRALAACDLEALATRRTDTLSGGELARVHMARALATEAPVLLADEPAAALDLKHQYAVMAVLRGFADAGGAVLAVLHDVALAARFASTLIWMKEARLVAAGPPADTLTAQRLAEVYGVDAAVSHGPHGPSIVVQGAAG